MVNVLIAGVFALIAGVVLFPIGLYTEKVTVKRLFQRCSAVTRGAYAGTDAVRRGSKTITYEMARFEADGNAYTYRLSHTQGIGFTTEYGAPLIVHYDPNDPSVCWASTPEEDAGGPQGVVVMKWLGLGLLVGGVVLVAASLLLS